jgi:serine/threonine protein phosphatase PrpC
VPKSSVKGNHPDNDDASDAAYDEVVIDESDRFTVGVADAQGKRETMEDAMCVCGNYRDNRKEDFFGIFDGHGGARAAIRASNTIADQLEEALRELGDEHVHEALTLAFKRTHEKIIADLEAGTTALVVYVRGDMVYVASTGDCRALALCRDGTWSRVTRDHRPTDPDEAAAVKARGGRILRGRVGATLGFTRGLGDRDMARFLSQVWRVD